MQEQYCNISLGTHCGISLVRMLCWKYYFNLQLRKAFNEFLFVEVHKEEFIWLCKLHGYLEYVVAYTSVVIVQVTLQVVTVKMQTCMKSFILSGHLRKTLSCLNKVS